MALRTLTPAGPLQAVVYNLSPLVMLPADIAAIAQQIRNDENAVNPVVNGAVGQVGVLMIPNRFAGLRCLPGDVIAVDSNGWPILISRRSIAAGTWTLS